MAREEFEDQDPENLNEELLEEGEGEEEEKEPSGAPGWFISVGVHSLFALIFYYAVWATTQETVELPPMKVTTIDPPPKKEEKKELDRQLDATVEINVASEANVAAP